MASPYDQLLASEAPVLQVSEAIAFCNSLLKELSLRIEGEVAGFKVNQGKWVFFDLKDEQTEATLNCFMVLNQLSTPLEDGMRVVVEARPGIVPKSGRFSLTVQRVTPKGQGSVKRAFELLLKKLQDEGLFAAERKRLLPRFVQRVGIISSEDAAGFGDFRKIAFSRLPGVDFLLAHVAVQGREAEAEICQAFDYLNSHYDLDCIVLIRGGGSMEDLHAFNSELVARAIVRSKAPVLVGVGHEKDITIADYAADKRASTPSNAAQLLLPTKEETVQQIIQLTQAGQRQVERVIQSQRERLLHQATQRKQRVQFIIQQYKDRVQSLIRTVEAISPEQTLKRGYSITTVGGSLLSSVEHVKSGMQLETRLTDGTITSITQ